MDREQFIKNRQSALAWWRSLTISEKQNLSKKHFPGRPFEMISSSSSNIQLIWELEKQKEA